MCVTFSCLNAPVEYRRVPCSSPSMGLTCTAAERCGYCVDGWDEEAVSEAPSLNLANDTAEDILRLAGVSARDDGGSLMGVLSPEAIHGALRTLLKASNLPEARAHLVEEPFSGHILEPHLVEEDDGIVAISCGPKVVTFGNTDDQTMSRIIRLREVLVYAAERGDSVTWA